MLFSTMVFAISLQQEFSGKSMLIFGMSMLFLYTFRDQLRLVYSFNDGYEEPEDIQMYLEEMQNILAQELLD